MINTKTAFSLFVAASVALSGALLAAEAKSYTASGTLLHVTDTTITIRTSTQDLDVTYDKKTKVIGGELASNRAAKVNYTKVAGVPYANEVHILKRDR